MIRVAKWNFDRRNITLDYMLEETMLEEEAQEFKDGLVDYFNAIKDNNKEAILDAKVEMVDAYADYRFVYQGTLFKSLGTLVKLGAVKDTLDYMEALLTEINIPKAVLVLSFDAVISANEAKGCTKINGKIQKGADWVDPKAKIREYIQNV